MKSMGSNGPITDQERVVRLSDARLLEELGEWISSSLSAHYEFGGDPPSELLGKYLSTEALARSQR